jgi:hypothetical protein
MSNIRQAWDGTLDRSALPAYNTLANGLQLARDAISTGRYHDVHCWVFTPLSLAALCLELADIDLLDFACAYFIDTAQYDAEFFLCMAACDSKAERTASWQRMRDSLQQ